VFNVLLGPELITTVPVLLWYVLIRAMLIFSRRPQDKKKAL
jgi:hypothetical protein